MLHWTPKALAKMRQSYTSFQVKWIDCFLHSCYRRGIYPKLGIIQGATQTLCILTCQVHLVPQGKLAMGILCSLLRLSHSSALSLQRYKTKIRFLFYLSKYQLSRRCSGRHFLWLFWDRNGSIFTPCCTELYPFSNQFPPCKWQCLLTPSLV